MFFASRFWIAAGIWLLAACGANGDSLQISADTAPDAGMLVASSTAACTSDEACADGLFCNGRERCLPDPDAEGALRCAPARGPACVQGYACDEAAGRCLDACEGEIDRDHDGHDTIDCGGSDCDDADPDRHPGLHEQCDEVDNDCDGLIDEDTPDRDACPRRDACAGGDDDAGA